ncbi:hypothetical protein ECG_00015 [Echinococcus granulosus]|uniref:Expressed conserved protein n=1 Tax=Echinococcus granulosus TaxID=6210 RepID=A0A068WYJ4_ECHGR|nr:hypothetical protein ECG_00015 [Echinococcus granulosus]CDS22746.1 expressed conserved protein [Echinococcus granulosus]
MCYIDFYERTKIHNLLAITGALLILTSIFMITLGIAREREDVWVAGILVAIAGAPVFTFGLFIFCYLNRPGRIPGLEQDFSVSKFSVPTIANFPPANQFFYPIKGYNLGSRIYRPVYAPSTSVRIPQQTQI